MPRLSLLSRIWLSTSVILTSLFGLTGWFLQKNVLQTTNETLQEEAAASFQAYESLWKSRSETLASVAAILASTPNVRVAFQTRHRPTIQDVAGELWIRVSDTLKENAFFIVADPEGRTIAALDAGVAGRSVPDRWTMVAEIRRQFPKQASGFSEIGGQLYQLVITPVYLDATQGSSALVSVLVTGFIVDHLVAQRLKESTGGSEFLFVAGTRVQASTLNPRARDVLRDVVAQPTMPELVSDGVSEYAPLRRELIDLSGKPVGTLSIFRSFDTARGRIRALQRSLFLFWLCAMAAGLGISYLLASRIVQPIRQLDHAAAELAQENYDHRVPVSGNDELGRLASAFNGMSESLQRARSELIRQERISTIGRMASSIVHDLRNPLAAIYGGAEMMVDTDLSPSQVKRVALNIYKSSRRIQEMLNELAQVNRGKSVLKEPCLLADVIGAAVEASQTAAQAQNVTIEANVPPEIELPLERSRIERVFVNLIGNALEVMPAGGAIRITVANHPDTVEVDLADSGPGISPEVRAKLFQPFFTHGKRNGLGLGLALSRQAVLDHGGDLWAVERTGPGATFRLRFPKSGAEAPAAESASVA